LSNKQFDIPLLAKSLAGIAKSFQTDSSELLVESARNLESLCDNGMVSKKYEPIYLAITGFAFDSAGEGPRSRKSYLRLNQMSLPIEDSLGNSQLLSRLYTEMLRHFGMREFHLFKHSAEEILRTIRTMQSSKETKHLLKNDDNYILLMGLLDLFLTYHEILNEKKSDSLRGLASSSKELEEFITIANSVPWLSIISRLSCRTINSAVKRSILNLDLPSAVLERMVELNKIELWKPQMDALSSGILEGNRMLLCTNTATGKSFLSSLVASKSSPLEKVAYLTPTRSLAEELGGKLKDYLKKTDSIVAVSTRERPENDVLISDSSIIVATYEKFNSLIKRRLLDPSNLKTLIVDEVHKISDHDRGLTVEFIMTRFNKLNGKSPQIVALSGMINDEDVSAFSSWLGAAPIKSAWRPVDLEESILLGNMLHYKNGKSKPAGFNIPNSGSDHARRLIATARLVQEEIVKDGQCLVVAMSRAKVETIADELSSILGSSLIPDINDLHGRERSKREEVINKILEIEPELPLYARDLISMIRSGGAYHHAGLPLRYRTIIEDAVRSKAIRVITSTTTLEAGVNLPVSMVIFPFPRDRPGPFNKMTTSTYRNLAGRAGRPDFDSKGKSILISLSKDEFEILKEQFFEKDDDPLTSAMVQFMKNVPQTRYALQTEILGLISDESRTEENIHDEMKKLWFWKKATPEDKIELPKKLAWEVGKLRRFECVEDRDGKVVIRQTGKIVNDSMLYAFSIKNLLDNCRLILSGKYDKERFDLLILSAVGIPTEMRSYDEMIKDIQVDHRMHFINKVLKQDSSLKEKYDDTRYCTQFATLLWFWINSYETERIIEMTGLKHTHAAFIEESLREDAYWVLSLIAKFPNDVLRMNAKQRRRVNVLAKFCKRGSSDPVVISLLELGLEHLGRATAIKIAKYMKTTNKRPEQLEQNDLRLLFPKNVRCADMLYHELKSALQNKGSTQ
jgi:replicative superfamily II helicase